ncbi:MAG: hypothetical protein ABGZ35_16330, partial [Planctomycetaceae bacterium]
QSDLASLGYMLIEMLTGARPFAGLKFAQLLDTKQALPARLASLLPQDEFAFIEPLTRFLQRLIDPDPSRRFATAGEAELSSEGAAGFLNELVKIDRSEEYASELRIWIAEMESNPVFDPAGRTDAKTVDTASHSRDVAATKLVPQGTESRSDSGNFELTQ